MITNSCKLLTVHKFIIKKMMYNNDFEIISKMYDNFLMWSLCKSNNNNNNKYTSKFKQK